MTRPVGEDERRAGQQHPFRRVGGERPAPRPEGFLVGLLVPRLVVVDDVALDPDRMAREVIRRQVAELNQLGSVIAHIVSTDD